MTIKTKMEVESQKGQKSLAVLVDPDKLTNGNKKRLIEACKKSPIDYIFYGGSLVQEERANSFIEELKEHINAPIVIFPGHPLQVYPNADAILFLSLISGRNPEFLIGHHVVAAPHIKKSGLEVIPTAYILVDGGVPTSASYMSNTHPIPRDKPDIAACTAMAGNMLGLGTVYMDAGSGAQKSINSEMISKVKDNIDGPLIVGGGIRDISSLLEASNAGADILVVGNAFERDPDLIYSFAECLKKENS